MVSPEDEVNQRFPSRNVGWLGGEVKGYLAVGVAWRRWEFGKRRLLLGNGRHEAGGRWQVAVRKNKCKMKNEK
jgi:hypothetical protein